MIVKQPFAWMYWQTKPTRGHLMALSVRFRAWARNIT